MCPPPAAASVPPPPPQQPPQPQPHHGHPPPPQPHQGHPPPPQPHHGHRPPPQPQYDPYYHNHHHPYHPRSKRSSNSFASCLLATLFLAAVIVAGVVTCFILFRPEDPTISIKSMKFPAFSLQNNTANFTFYQYVAVRNPNRYSFNHYDSSLQLFSAASGPVGFMYIPAGQIAAGRTQYMSATFEVRSFPVPPETVEVAAVSGGGGGGGGGGRPGATMELESRMKLVGTVKVMKVFAHHVEKGVVCRVTIQVSDATVLGYHC